MNVPSGYTALDLIGFTDRGDYDAQENYVKNDLVHYNGRVWLCLVDDTTAITPVAGANWKVWIDEAAYLSGLADVTISNPANGEAIRYNSQSGKWENVSVDSTPTSGSANLVQSGGVATQLANKANTADLATVATTGAYSDLSGTPQLAAVATSGAYSDLTGQPTIPTVNDATLTIQKNGTNVETFTANSSTNKTANITVPDVINDLSNVNISSVANEEILAYDSTSSKWKNSGALGALKETFTNFEESITGEVVDSEPYVLRQGLGNLADMALVGGSVAWNQLVRNGNFADTSGWGINGGTLSVSSNKATLTADGSIAYVQIYRDYFNIITGHKYIAMFDYDASNISNFVRAMVNSTNGSQYAQIGGYVTANKGRFATVGNATVNATRLMFAFVTSGNASGNGMISNVNVIDLTQLFGSTIADYIYSLEQATTGAGVAWFRKYFPNDYYAYQSGKIESVNPVSRKVMGKNLAPKSTVDYTIYNVKFKANSDGEITVNGTGSNTAFRGVSTEIFFYLPAGTYIFNGQNNQDPINKKLTLQLYDVTSNLQICNMDTNADYPFTWTTPSHQLAIRVGLRAGVSVNNAVVKPMVRSDNISDATYEPSTEYSYPFDPSIQLRGIPKLVDNKLSYDGDIYTADGTVTRKYGIKTFNGSEGWEASGTNGYVIVAGSSGLSGAKASALLISNIFLYSSTIWADGYIGMNASKTLWVGDTNNAKFNNVDSFKTYLSNNPLTIVYELATPTTETANGYQNPQRAFTDGTEEFIDAGVTGATRDVSIPVGNNTTYQLNETLPPTQDYVDGAGNAVLRRVLSQPLPSGADFNNYIEEGNYWADSTISSTLVNCPTSSAIHLEVKKTQDSYNSLRVVQLVYPNVPSDGYFYMRCNNAGTWRSWYKFQGTVVS